MAAARNKLKEALQTLSAEERAVLNTIVRTFYPVMTCGNVEEPHFEILSSPNTH